MMEDWKGTMNLISFETLFFSGCIRSKKLPFHRKFTLDDLLTNVMIYWTTRSIIPSMRFYKENLKSNIDKRVDARYVDS